ncbi:MAG TPA: thiamine phosphate synthase [Verrucomicrobiae bacterium]|jgi:thiamine-phosphate pyrophosphorylase|nr:thiamine phosphate synthase [Verrucomicrobiae bacterium]
MSERFTPFPLYAILDTESLGGRAPLEVLRQFLFAGAKLVQLRAKDVPSKEFFALAQAVREMTRRAGAMLIVNDRADIALSVHADGGHLGQEDLPLAAARKIAGGKLVIGVSTHDLAQAKEAEAGGADYIGFGPIFGTATKQTGYSPRGLDMLREVKKAVKIPVVAIGGIKEANVAEVWKAGADSAAIISDLMGAEDVKEKVGKILARMEKCK